MIHNIEIGTGVFSKVVRNEVLTQQLRFKIVEAHNYQRAHFPYGPVSSDYRYDMRMRFNPIISGMNKLMQLPWMVGPCVNIYKIRQRSLTWNVNPQQYGLAILPYKSSVASMNEYLANRHVFDLERHYV